MKLHFPFPSIRPEQTEAVSAIKQAFDEGVTDIFAMYPTGIGKSGIAMLLAINEAEQEEGSTYVSTASILLEDQYMRDFAQIGLKQLHSKAHYSCKFYKHCGIGWNHDCEDRFPTNCAIPGDECPYTKDCLRETEHKMCDFTDRKCPYYNARKAWHESPISIANSDFMLTSARFIKGFPARTLAIFDEAHKLFPIITNLYKVEIEASKHVILPAHDEDDEAAYAWLQKIMPVLKERLTFYFNEELAAIKAKDDGRILETYTQWRQLKSQITNISVILSGNPEDWSFDRQKRSLVVTPLWADKYGQNLLGNIGEKRLYMSATLIGWQKQAKWLGIDPNAPTTCFLEKPSPFPIKNRSIFLYEALSWEHFEGYQTAYEQIPDALRQVLHWHPDERGIIFVSSYEQMEQVLELCDNPRLIGHTKETKDEALERFRETPGSVFVSPSSHEGLDLPDDLSRFQIILKLPFDALDKLNSARMHIDPAWYPINTAQKLVQAFGRSVRSVDDYATTYILDRKFLWFYNRHRKLFPEYIQKAMFKITNIWDYPEDDE